MNVTRSATSPLWITQTNKTELRATEVPSPRQCSRAARLWNEQGITEGQRRGDERRSFRRGAWFVEVESHGCHRQQSGVGAGRLREGMKVKKPGSMRGMGEAGRLGPEATGKRASQHSNVEGKASQWRTDWWRRRGSRQISVARQAARRAIREKRRNESASFLPLRRDQRGMEKDHVATEWRDVADGRQSLLGMILGAQHAMEALASAQLDSFSHPE